MTKPKHLLIFFSLLILSCTKEGPYTPLAPEENEELSGGDATIFDVSRDAFGNRIHNLNDANETSFFVGKSLFRQSWVASPASTTARDGLGPLFNARACTRCHVKDGRGRPPSYEGELSHGLLFRLSVPGKDSHGENLPEPNYGGQLQDIANSHIEPEGNYRITYQDKTITYPDGETVILQKPIYEFTNLTLGPLAGDFQFSPRVANQMIGLGLLEAIPENSILENTDELDTDKDGVSGRANYVWDIKSQSTQLGRFGWKANQPNLLQQTAGAFLGDMGITSSLFPNNNCPPNVDCDTIPHGGALEIEDHNLENVTIYSATLAVPARRNWDDEHILEGKELFKEANCAACHIPKFKTGVHPTIPALSNQVIRPYTDMLLHDMGDELADNRPDFLAMGNEWRTPPLWGTGLLQTVNKHTRLLHDGRARNVEEAILWHGGEATNAVNHFKNYSKENRQKLIDFINTL